MNRFSATALTGVLSASLCFSITQTAYAGSATWNLNPGTSDWNTAANWTPATVPNGLDDSATFDLSNTTDVFMSNIPDEEISAIVFNADAPAFTIHLTSLSDAYLALNGVGFTNNSPNTQTLVLEPTDEDGGTIAFFNSVSAANLNILDLGSNQSEGGSKIVFFDTSSASDAFITMNASSSDAADNQILFYDSSSASQATLIANPGTGFGNGATILFLSDSAGGKARIEVLRNPSTDSYTYGMLDISDHNSPGMSGIL